MKTPVDQGFSCSSLCAGLGRRIELERLETSAYASETHLRFRVIR
jgi:hypothetical protein